MRNKVGLIFTLVVALGLLLAAMAFVKPAGASWNESVIAPERTPPPINLSVPEPSTDGVLNIPLAKDFSVATEESVTSQSKVISITYDFPEPRIERTRGIPLARDLVSVTMEGLPQWSEVGLPILPFRTARILLPYGTEGKDITVICGNRVILPGTYLVEPGQESFPLSYEGLVEPTAPDSDAYNSSSPFPGELHSNTVAQGKAGHTVLLVNLHPVEYIPKEGQLSYYRSMTVEVVLEAAVEGKWLAVRGLPQDWEAVRTMVDNPEIISTYTAAPIKAHKASLLDPSDYDYVIITSEALEAAPGPYNFQALRDNKISRGITATIVTTEWIYGNYSGSRPDGGSDNQTRIRNFIIDAYDTWGTTYVLLGGDGDGGDVGGESGDAIIPHRGFKATACENTNYDVPADMYYACLDGTFDDDADGIYGEPNDGPGGGEVDLFAEVYVGRAPVDSQAEVANFIRKTLAYQNTSISDENLREVWMLGEHTGFLGVSDWGGNYKDEIKEGSSAYGYTTIGFEDSIYSSSFDVETLYDRDYPGNSWPKSEIIGIINGNVHLINHCGHANNGNVMKMYNSDADALTNDELYFIGYSQGCYDGAFDNRNPYGSYTNHDCIVEHLTTEAHGAVAFVANSRYGLGSMYSLDSASQHYDREFWDAILGENIFALGIANQDSKEDNAGRIAVDEDRWCYYEINLFGDPELSVKFPEGPSPTPTSTSTPDCWVNLMTEDFEGIFPGNWSVGDLNSNYGEDYWGDTSYRSHSGSWSGWCAEVGSQTVTTTIFTEGFEGAFPGVWFVGDSDSNSGDDYWDDTSYRALLGNRSGWCADIGENSFLGGTNAEHHQYDNDMNAYMYRTIDVSAYQSATLSYWYWLDSESGFDTLSVIYYDGGYWYFIDDHTGNTSGWQWSSVSIPTNSTQVGFYFSSNGSVLEEGAYIDYVQLTTSISGPNSVLHQYDNSMNASMSQGPFNLSDAVDAELNFWYWNDAEYGWDYFKWLASADGSNFYGYNVTGNSAGWQHVSFNLTNVPTLGNLCGQPNVWIAFDFESDSGVHYYEGTYVDDVVLRKCIPTPTPTPGMPGDANDNGEISAGDITKVERIILTLDEETPNADANQDGDVNATDIGVIEYMILGIWPWNHVHIEAPDNIPYCTHFTATVFITYVEDFGSASFEVSYNASVLDLEGVANGKLMEIDPGVSTDFYTVNVTDWSQPGGPGTLLVNASVAGNPGPDGAGYLAQLHFHVIGSAGQNSPIAFNVPQSWLKDNVSGGITATWEDDSVTVAP